MEGTHHKTTRQATQFILTDPLLLSFKKKSTPLLRAVGVLEQIYVLVGQVINLT